MDSYIKIRILTNLEQKNMTKQVLGQVFVVVNQKGGVGKTTTSANLGKNLASLGRKVIIVDIDPQGDLTDLIYAALEAPAELIFKMPGGSIEPGVVNSYMLFQQESTPKTAKVEVGKDKVVEVIPTTSHLARIDKEDLSAITIFRDKVRELAKEVDYVILDCPPGMGNIQTAALAAAHKVIIPTELESLSVKNIDKLKVIIGNLKKHMNPEIELLGILKTRTKTDKSKTKIMKHYNQELKDDYPGLLFETEITSGTDVSTATAMGMSIHEYKPKSKQAIQYMDLTKEIDQRVVARLDNQNTPAEVEVA